MLYLAWYVAVVSSILGIKIIASPNFDDSGLFGLIVVIAPIIVLSISVIRMLG